jgi:peptidoglycan/LPS O-acetylase OafA/YrhL
MVHVLVILLLTNVFTTAEKYLRLKLRTDIVVDGQHYSGIGPSLWQGDLVYLFLLALVIATATWTFRVVEKPWRDYSRRVVAQWFQIFSVGSGSWRGPWPLESS